MNAIADSRPVRSTLAYLALALALAAAPPAPAASSAPRTFATPDEAAAALAAALKAGDSTAILAVLGQAAAPLINSGDPVADRHVREQFVEKYDEAHSIVGGADGRSVLEIGTDQWPFPIPLEKSAAGWQFDAVAGKDEVLDRRIGRNELSAIQACLAFVDAQQEYYQRNPDHSSLLHYALVLASTPGKRDGLYWATAGDEQASPLGPGYARARAEGYKGTGREAYHGYYYRILTAQGPDARGGAYDYMAHGKMIGGFALVAYPAKWDNSGVMTFIVNQDGVVFEKDLGPDTAAKANALKSFNPDSTWKRVEPETPAVQANS